MKQSGTVRILRRIRAGWQYYLLLLPAVISILVFSYGPMYGVQIALKNSSAGKGIWGSPWVGFMYFERFFRSPYFSELIVNTLRVSLYDLILGFPLPILLALCLNEIRQGKVKKVFQTVTYAPHFISAVVLCGMVTIFLDPSSGVINRLIVLFGGEPVAFLTNAAYFPLIYALMNVWQNMGWGSIIYLAALSGVDEQLYESAMIDGATKAQKIRYINLPHLLPTITVLLILDCGKILTVGYEKIYLLQNDLNAETSEVISTYVYKAGLINTQYSFSTAVGLFNSVVNLILLVLVNTLSRRFSENSLW